MKTKIYLVRHARTVANDKGILSGVTDVEVSIEGKKQIDAFTPVFRNVKLDRIYTSPLSRTRETIDQIAQEHHLEPIVIRELIEKNNGIAETMTIDQVDQIMPGVKVMFLPNGMLPDIEGAETLEQAQKRIVDTVLYCAKENLGNDILICTHGFVLKLFIWKLLNRDSRKIYPNISIENTSITTVEYDSIENKMTLLEIANCDHLKK